MPQHFELELRYVAFPGDTRVLQLRTRAPGGPWSQWDFITDDNIPTVDAQDIRAVDYVYGARPHGPH